MTKTIEDVQNRMREILGDKYLVLRVDSIRLDEDLNTGESAIACELHHLVTGEKQHIEGRGVGVIDAFFNALKSRFDREYQSLKSIRFTAFRVEAKVSSDVQRSGSDAIGEVRLEITNSYGRTFNFVNASRSVTKSSIITTLQAVEYFVNSERAYVNIHHAWQDAKQRNRSDLVQKYASMLSELVENTSYSEVLESLKKSTR